MKRFLLVSLLFVSGFVGAMNDKVSFNTLCKMSAKKLAYCKKLMQEPILNDLDSISDITMSDDQFHEGVNKGISELALEPCQNSSSKSSSVPGILKRSSKSKRKVAYTSSGKWQSFKQMKSKKSPTLFEILQQKNNRENFGKTYKLANEVRLAAALKKEEDKKV